ncbi:MAG: hypothetical protein ABSA54_24175 [Terriglobales bacterium]
MRQIEEGKTQPAAKTVVSAVQEWLVFREKNGLSTEKPTLMGKKLKEWCAANSITYLHELTPDAVIRFRNSLPYKTKTSSSLKIHWSVISGFFGWCHGGKLISENPVPNPKLYPQFKIKVQKPEVIPPTVAEVEKVIALVERDRTLWLFVQTMRHSGMAIRDTTILSRAKFSDNNLIRGNRTKTDERYRVRVPMWLANAWMASTNTNHFFWDGETPPKSVVLHYERELRKVFKAANVKMTPHGFRHFFISQQLAAGVSVGDVAKMVGTSPQEIRKTYEHWIKETEDRLDTLQAEVWVAQGLDENGNKKPVN